MAWITLTAAHVKTRISDAEYSGVTEAALASDQDSESVVSQVVAAVVREIRGHVAASGKNVLGEGATIPDELEDAALAVIRGRIFTRLPGLKDLYDEVRQKETDAALRLFERVAAGLFAIEQPQTVSEQIIATPAVHLVNASTRVATREKLRGL